MTRQKTITLDEDVAEKLDREARRAGTTNEEIANAALRRTLRQSEVKAAPFTIHPRHMGKLTGLNLDCMERLLNEIEGPNWK
ncbi:MAG: ribbon-helix-helix domain-containing protein [Acidobacteriota bacterium]|nr:ribbon-helix-helix domain-containing protein [Acidobacteriota bacterium]